MQRAFSVLLFALLAPVALCQTSQEIREVEKLLEEGEHKRALKAVNKLEKTHGTQEKLMWLKGNAQVDAGSMEEALETFTQLQKSHPENPYGYIGRARVFMLSYQNLNGAGEFTKALPFITEDSLLAHCLFNRAACYASLGRHQDALTDALAAYNTDTANTAYLNDLAMYYNGAGQQENALAAIKKVVAMDPGLEPGYSNLGFQLSQMERYAEAEKVFLEGLERFPQSPYMLNNLGYVVYKLGRLGEAKDYIKQSIALFPSNSYAYRNLALVYIDEKDFGEACKYLHKALTYGFAERYGTEVSDLRHRYCIKSGN